MFLRCLKPFYFVKPCLYKRNITDLHIPVIHYITEKSPPNAIIIDGTCGCGGHTKRILETNSSFKMLCIDRDPNSIEISKNVLSEHLNRITFYNGNYKDFGDILKINKFPSKVNGILLDLGFGSHQISNEMKGLNFTNTTTLDMRYNTNDKLTAKEIVNTYSEEKIKEILIKYGCESERNARNISFTIIDYRKNHEIKTCLELSNLILTILPYKNHKHPATKLFQALRIEVNKELDNLKHFLEIVPQYLEKNGRVVILSFQDLEAKIIKSYFRKYCYEERIMKVVRTAQHPTKEEIRNNIRSRSALLWCLEKN